MHYRGVQAEDSLLPILEKRHFLESSQREEAFLSLLVLFGMTQGRGEDSGSVPLTVLPPWSLGPSTVCATQWLQV